MRQVRDRAALALSLDAVSGARAVSISSIVSSASVLSSSIATLPPSLDAPLPPPPAPSGPLSRLTPGLTPGLARPPPESIEFGASPDALLEDVDDVYPGGVALEVKCPYRQGAPQAQHALFARQVPQLQGALLATGRQTAHLVSWAPSGCAVFELERDAAYQQALLEYLVAFAACASEQRPPGRAEAQHAVRVRAHSKRVARNAAKVGFIDAADCVTLLPE